MKQEEDGKPKYYIHSKMLSVDLVKFYCTTCHKKVDLGKRKPDRVKITIDRKLCLNCHEWNTKLSEAELEKADYFAKSDERRLHVFVLHGSDKKSSLKWVQTDHYRVAKTIGVEKCRRCHIQQSELDFCGTTCHKSPF